MLNDSSIREQLSTAESGLLSALRGEKDLATYHTEFAQLLDTISISTSTGRLDGSIAVLAQNVAMRIESIADCFAEIESESRGLRDRLHNGWRNLLAELPASSPSQARVFHSEQAGTADDRTVRRSDYLSLAYKWLLANLHNPYPTVEVKERIASRTACSVASINSWFISVRRRIGWTAICREYFRNCRANAADAAYRVLVEKDASQTVSSEVAQAFLAMKMTAKGLYSSTFAKSPLSVDLDEVVKNMIEGDSSHSDDNSKETEKPVRQTGDEVLLARSSPRSYRWTLYSSDAYPSSRHSRSPSPVPTLETSFSSESDDEDEVSPPIIAGQKRNTGFSDGSDGAYGSVCVRKRRRISTASDGDATVSLCDIVPLNNLSGNESLTDSPKAPSQVTSMSHRTRKRRLSDAEGQFYSKRPQGPRSGSRVQAVSDPLPKSNVVESNINDWFNINFPDTFEVPPPVNVDELDPSSLWSSKREI
ncbi:C-terminal domain of homeodomain 1-domain-containing protein [Pisolithus marmoratus]|nr:C-terminal domain of homeodomain 1-domain-containing protein [Pisolithus marmoratus]